MPHNRCLEWQSPKCVRHFLRLTIILLALPFLYLGQPQITRIVAVWAQSTNNTENSAITRFVNPIDGATYLYVPAASFQMGRVGDDAFGTGDMEFTLKLDDYWIKKVRVTHAEYARCVAAGACDPPRGDPMNPTWDADDVTLADEPVGGVTWYQATDYARWVGGRLPTEAEWEKACRGTDGRIFPWGNEPPPLDPNEGAIVSTMTGNDPRAASPYGALNMAGTTNAEWTSTLYQDYPYDAADGRENQDTFTASGERTVRGGVFPSSYNTECAYRGSWEISSGYFLARIGVYMEFRVVMDAEVVAKLQPAATVSIARNLPDIFGRSHWLSDGQILTESLTEQKLKQWDVAKGQRLAESDLADFELSRMVWSPDGTKVVLLGIEDRSWYIVEGRSGRTISNLRNSYGAIGGLIYEDGTYIDEYEDADGVLHKVPVVAPLVEASNLRWSSDGQFVTTENIRTWTTTLWDAATGEAIQHLPGLRAIWSPDATQFLIIDEPDLVMVWNAATMRLRIALASIDEIVNLENDFSANPNAAKQLISKSIAWSPTGRYLAIPYTDGDRFGIWDTRNGKLLRTIQLPFRMSNMEIRWSPDESLIALGGYEVAARVLQANDGTLLWEAPYQPMWVHVEWASDGQRLLLYAEDETPRPDPPTRTGVALVWDAHTTSVHAVLDANLYAASWNPSSTQVMATRPDGTLVIWDVPPPPGTIRLTPTATPAPTPATSLLTTPTPAVTTQATPSTASKATVNDSSNLRAGPGTNYPIVGKASKGTSLEIVGRNAAGDWCQLADGAWIAAFLVDNVPPNLPEVDPPSTPPSPSGATPLPAATPQSPPSGTGRIIFDGDPRQSGDLCDGGFRSDCDFAGCGAGSRLVWGPFCRARDHSYIEEPGSYKVTVYGSGSVIAGATDFGPTEERYTFGSQQLTLPSSYTFCWPGLVADGFGFETIVEGIDGQARVDSIVIEFTGEECN